MTRAAVLAVVVALAALLAATGAVSAPRQYPPPDYEYPTPTPPPASTSTTSSTQAVTPKTRLVLTSGPSFVITLKTRAGKTVKTMKRGTYTITVRDRADIHNAHVIAPGANRKTAVTFVGSQTWKLKLARTGKFRFFCDPHGLTGMKGSAKIVR